MKQEEHKFLRKCPICGKMFWCDNLDMWVYKKGYRNRMTGKISLAHSLLFCSYHCMREYEKQRQATVRPFNNIAMDRGE